jgi:CubicO group peptidase (beta-lactamase class C family)
MGETGTASYWADRLREVAEQNRVPGAVLGIWADGRELLAAHGVLNARTRVGTTTDSLFQVGSITKVWTATMAMQLVREGRLSLDTTVSQVLPGVPIGTPDGSEEIRLRHLLTHSSGIEGDVFDDTGRGSDCLERYAAVLATVARVFPPGAAFSYCNSGFSLLGQIIEVLDGGEWDESLRRRLVGPLGLTQTTTLPEEAIMHRAAVGHAGPPREDQPVTVWAPPRSAGPAGLITASAHDVLVFARMHLTGGRGPDGTRVLDEDLVTTTQQPQMPMPATGSADGAIGLAWHLTPWDGNPVIGHDGATIGQTAHLRIAPQSGVAACLLTNSPSAKGLYETLFAEVFAEFAQISMPASPHPVAEPPALDLARHAGRYERTSKRYDVSLRDGRLHVIATLTGTLAEISGAEPEEVVLYPADASGDHFVTRSHEHEPWNLVSFGQLSDGTPFLYGGHRITPRTGG